MQNSENHKVSEEVAAQMLNAGLFDNGEVMATLKERFHSLPYIAKLAAVLLADLHYLECQASFHEGVADLIRSLHKDVINPQEAPIDPQASELLTLYRMAQPLQESGDNQQWRGLVRTWAESITHTDAKSEMEGVKP